MGKQISMTLQVTKSEIPALSSEHIGRVMDAISVHPESQIYISVPAGPNRDLMAASIARFTTAVADDFPRMSFTVRVAVDDVELKRLGMTVTEIKDFPGVKNAEQLFNHDRIRIEPKEQVESNSVIEVVEAMRHAASSGEFTHLFVPRDSRILLQRISLGLRHYARDIEGDSLISADLMQIPGEARQRKARGIALEVISYLATKCASFAGSGVFESYLEKRGGFSAVLKKVHDLKVQMFRNSRNLS